MTPIRRWDTTRKRDGGIPPGNTAAAPFHRQKSAAKRTFAKPLTSARHRSPS